MKPTGRTLIGACVVGVAAALTPHGLSAAESRYALKDEPRPSNIRVQETPLGAVFADSRGMTLYTDRQETKPNTPVCLNSVPKREVNDPTDLRGDVPLPPGETCLTKHPAVLVGDAQPVGPWTVLDRPDGIKQWAYNGRAVYTSVKDLVPGHVRMSIDTNLRQGRKRFLPLYAPLDLPPDIGVQPVGFVAKVFATHTGKTLYTLTMDRAGKSACEGACLDKWQPHLGGSLSQARGDWSLVARRDGTRQWAFRGKPLYTYADDKNPGDAKGNNLPGALVAVAYMAPRAPQPFTIQTTPMGDLYADAAGKTIYAYICPGTDGRECDEPTDKNHWWFVDCGATAEKCAKEWLPVRASDDAKPTADDSWSIVTMPLPWAPVRAADGSTEPGIKVWAFQGRPLFTYAHEDLPGMIDGLDIGTLGGARWFALMTKGIDLNAKATVVQAAR